MSNGNLTYVLPECVACESSCSYLTPDPDVAGLGVVISFLTTSALTWACAMIQILDWFLNGDGSSNRVDRVLQLQTRKPRPRNSNHSPSHSSSSSFTAPSSSISSYLLLLHSPQASISTQPRPSYVAFASAIAYLVRITAPLLLCLHDTQLASGLAISATSLIRHRSNTISVYHFSIAADLAWIASGSQLVCFLFVRWALREETRTRASYRSTHTAVQYFRALCMTAQFALLIWQSVVQGNERWDYSYACPSICLDPATNGRGYGERVFGGAPLQWMCSNIVLATWSYSAALLPMCSPFQRLWSGFKVRCGFVGKSLILDASRKSIGGGLKIIQTCVFVAVASWNFLASMMLDTLMQLGWFVFGIWCLVVDRNWGKAYFAGDAIVGNGCEGVGNTENEWGFGQIYPVMLLILFVMSLLQAYGDEVEKDLSRGVNGKSNPGFGRYGITPDSDPDAQDDSNLALLLQPPLPLHVSSSQLHR